ncbi:hypothetical protein [Arthrobacter sp. B2a2-09]|uniref:hypothetical protein n=1 Tax=Arthrobacter sp. B2a2-09 TaxID=2952822 RepID=UPI0022CD43BC|nr:hypothetical protein [Arthrobacter sp. B2a2-09]MCZ9882725.1 hypothetical protein [Arthrobacter sp. B2a2-09]
METQNFGTVEVPPELRRSFLFVPSVFTWLFAALALVGLIWGSVYASTTENQLIAAGRLSSGSSGYFRLTVAEFMAPAFVLLISSRLLMRGKAKRMADLAAERLFLPHYVRDMLQKRFTKPWSMRLDGRVNNLNLRSRLGYQTRDRIEQIRSKEGWVIEVPSDLSTLTVERVPPGYEMNGDYQYSGGSLRKLNKAKRLENQQHGGSDR